MAKSYNWLGAQKVNDLSIGLCPVCNRRLSAECEHRTIESEEWYALHLVAEQEAHNEKATDPYRRPFDRDDADILAAARTVSPDAVLTSGDLARMAYGEYWMTEAEADAQEFRDVKFGSKKWFDNVEEIPF